MDDVCQLNDIIIVHVELLLLWGPIFFLETSVDVRPGRDFLQKTDKRLEHKNIYMQLAFFLELVSTLYDHSYLNKV